MITLRANQMMTFIMLSKGCRISEHFIFRDIHFPLVFFKFLSLLLADITEVVHVYVVSYQLTVVIEDFLLAKHTSQVVLILVISQLFLCTKFLLLRN